ncbi:MAG: TolC family protein, partial [Myxococcota bacterium]
ALLQIDVFERRVKEAIERLRVTTQRFDAGNVAKTAVLEAKSALASAKLNLTRARSELTSTNAALRQATLDKPDVRYTLASPAPFEDFAPPPSPAETPILFEQALKQRVERTRLQQLIRALASTEGLAWARGLPVLEAYGGLLSANPNPRFIPNRDVFDTTWEVGVRLAWSPNDWLIARADKRSAASETEKVRARLAELEIVIHRQLVEARQGILEAQASLVDARDGLSAAEAAYANRKLTFEEGATTLLDLLQSETALVGAQLQAIRAKIQARIAVVRLDNAVGRDVESVLGRAADLESTLPDR